MFRELAIKVRLLRTYGKKTWDIFGSLSELCTFPPRLFATEELLLAADTKSELANSFPSLEDPASNNWDDMKYVIDGGMLIAHTPDYLESWIFIHRYLCELCFFSVEISAMHSCVRRL